GEPVTVPIDLKEISRKLRSAVESKADTVLLDLEGVEAEQQPGTVWAVYAGLPAEAAADANSPSYIGALSLFGSGIRSEKHHEFQPAHFVYPLNRAMHA